MPIFEQKLGKNKPLKMLIKFSHFETQFGKYDTDCIFDYTMGISWYLDTLGSKELIYDEIKMVTDRKSTRLNSSHSQQSRMPSSA